MKKAIAALVLAMPLLGACANDADVASKNLSKDADNFKILRRAVFYNGITGDYVLSVEGYCSLGNSQARVVTITCKTVNEKGEDVYKKHFLGLSDNVTYFVEQRDAAKVSASFYKVILKPTVILPDIELR